MIASIFPSWFTALSTALAGGVLLLLRYFRKKDSPATRYEEAKSENAKIIETHDANALNAGINADLDRLRDDGPGSGHP